MAETTWTDGQAGELTGELVFGPDTRANPHPIYHRMRTEVPRFWNAPDRVWILTRYEDCEAVLRDPRWSSNPQHLAEPPPLEEASVRESMATTGTNILLFLDPPNHTRIRNLVSRNFTPKAMQAWRPRIEQIVAELLEDLAERGEVELIEDFAFQVPVTVICELLGVPVEDRHLFGPWSSAAGRLLDGDLDAATMQAGLMGAMQLINYLNPLIEERRTSPRDDLLSAIVHAQEDEHRLSDEELRSLVILLFVAGHETTTNLIGNGTKALLEHPDELQRLRDDPTLIAPAVEEILRFDGPVHVTGRIPTEDITLGDQVFRKGTQVVTLLAAANRDPAMFPEPDRFDIGRDPNHHIAFSKGIHHCLGAALARLEGQLAIGGLVQRFPSIELVERPIYREHFVLRGLDALHLRVS